MNRSSTKFGPITFAAIIAALSVSSSAQAQSNPFDNREIGQMLADTLGGFVGDVPEVPVDPSGGTGGSSGPTPTAQERFIRSMTEIESVDYSTSGDPINSDE